VPRINHESRDVMNQFNLDPNTNYVKVHGLQRSGTNLMAYLIDYNFENTKALVNIGGWKHGPYCAPWMLGQEVHVVSVCKNPYSWLVSVYKYWSNNPVGPNLQGVSFDQFVRNRLIAEQASGNPCLYRASNPVQYWNNMNCHWLTIRLNTKKSLFVPYEYLLIDPVLILKNMAKELGLNLKAEVELLNKVLEPGEETFKAGSEDWTKKDYYLKEEYLNEFTSELLEFVNTELDVDVMSSLGYKPVFL
jgi:hypothetical protein